MNYDFNSKSLIATPFKIGCNNAGEIAFLTLLLAPFCTFALFVIFSCRENKRKYNVADQSTQLLPVPLPGKVSVLY